MGKKKEVKKQLGRGWSSLGRWWRTSEAAETTATTIATSASHAIAPQLDGFGRPVGFLHDTKTAARPNFETNIHRTKFKRFNFWTQRNDQCVVYVCTCVCVCLFVQPGTRAALRNVWVSVKKKVTRENKNCLSTPPPSVCVCVCVSALMCVSEGGPQSKKLK